MKLRETHQHRRCEQCGGRYCTSGAPSSACEQRQKWNKRRRAYIRAVVVSDNYNTPIPHLAGFIDCLGYKGHLPRLKYSRSAPAKVSCRRCRQTL